MPYVRVAVNVPSVTGMYDYHLPAELAGRIGAGHLVLIPFGKQTVQGVVVQLPEQPSVAATKPVLELLDPVPALTAAQIEFAQQLAAVTLNPLAAIIDLFIPPGLSQQADVLYELTADDGPRTTKEGPSSAASPLGIVHRRIIDLLTRRGPLRGRQIDRHFKQVDWRKSAGALVRRGILKSQSVLPPPGVRPKFVRTAQLAVPPEAAETAMPELGKTAATLQRRQKALRVLMGEPDAVNVSWVYAGSGCTLADLQDLAERELIMLRETEIWRDPLQRVERDLPMPRVPAALTADQQAAWNAVEAGFREQAAGKGPSSFLLHGVTGSGKTEIYLRATAEALRRGKQAVILVPEIALTPQTVRRFLARFPGRVGLLHSKLSPGERYDTWRRARNGSLSVIIGPRSALFAPLPDVGLVVADECHDSSYHQSEPPFYHAVEAARLYARISGAICILGSATPPVALRYTAVRLSPGAWKGAERRADLRLLELPRRLTPLEGGGVADGTALPPVRVVDMREELKAGERGIFSRRLRAALGEVLGRGEQAILFLNRRGTATYVFCRECGTVVRCPRCETPLVQHTQLPGVELLCHRCGYQRKLPKTCPECGGGHVRAYGLGSEKVEAEVKALFPAARALRWDWETTREKDAHEIILSHFVNHRADVLVGTQMLAKGLDLPLVTLVGIVLADVGLNLPDPFAAERSFQLLTQVAGRAGRSERGGEVILQTFQPEHEVIRAAAGHDYAGFYEREIAGRRRLGYPPFARLVRLEFRHRDNAEAEKATVSLAGRIKKKMADEKRIETGIVGPVPCFFAKVDGQFRWQLVLRGPDPASLVPERLPDGWRVEVEPVSLL